MELECELVVQKKAVFACLTSRETSKYLNFDHNKNNLSLFRKIFEFKFVSLIVKDHRHRIKLFIIL